MKRKPVSTHAEKSCQPRMRASDEGRNFVVIGKTGSGKTCFLQDVLQQMATREAGK